MPLIAGAVGAALVPEASSAENLLDFLFRGLQTPQQQQQTATPAPPRPVAAGSGPAFCVRSCDGKYFPLMRGAASPAQLCQAFCPAARPRCSLAAASTAPAPPPANGMPGARM